jgi:hypothetical protein
LEISAPLQASGARIVTIDLDGCKAMLRADQVRFVEPPE